MSESTSFSQTLTTCIKNFFCIAHNKLKHFRVDKTYAALKFLYYWTNIQRDFICSYILSWVECQYNKSSTKKLLRPLHILPILNCRFRSVTLDFVRPLLLDKGYDQFCSMMCHAGANIQIFPCQSTQIEEEFTNIFFKD